MELIKEFNRLYPNGNITSQRIMTEETDCDTKGLRFCGGWDVQLSGMSSAIASGRNVAFATLNDINAGSKEGL